MQPDAPNPATGHAPPVRSLAAGGDVECGTRADAGVGEGLHGARQHYVYRLTDSKTGEFYVGVRSCSCPPGSDRQYRGSGGWPREAVFDRRPLRKEVLATFESRVLAEEAELLLIDMVVLDRLCRNSIKTASEDIKAPRRTKKGYV